MTRSTEHPTSSWEERLRLHQINYRSVADLDQTIVANLHRIPRDVNMVAGVPRSGVLAGTLIALHLNLRLSDVDSLATSDHVYSVGRNSKPRGTARAPQDRLHVLVVDDSIFSGTQVRAVRKRLKPLEDRFRFTYLAVYGITSHHDELDICLETVPKPRFFEWNLMRHRILETACLDLDGVICRDPTPEENDDGPKYADFVRNADPLLIPAHEVGCIVTGRLEKYRPHTEQWLARHGIRYRELIMVDLPDKATRDRYHCHASFKAEVYKAKPWALLFIESTRNQAEKIAASSRKPVFCIEDRTLYHPPGSIEIARWTRTTTGTLAHRTYDHLRRAAAWFTKPHTKE